MHRVAVAMLLSSLVLAGCDSGSPESDTSAGSRTETSSSTSATYFAAGDSNAINEAAAAALSAGAKASSVTRTAACNSIQADPGWRRCWHALLDPYSKRLKDVGAVLTSLHAGGFPRACHAELAVSAQTFISLAGQISDLLASIDGGERLQVRFVKRYLTTLDGIAQSFAKPFQALTQACLSPRDLASINAAPTPSP